MNSDNPYAAPEPLLDPQGIGFGHLPLVLPTLAKAIAVISIILGGFNIFGGLCAGIGMPLFVSFFDSPQMRQEMEKANPNDARQLRKQIDNMRANMPIYVGQSIASVVISVGLIAGAIGVLMRKEWGRKTLVISAVLYVVLSAVGWIATVYIMRNQGEMTAQEQLGAIIGGIFGAVFGLVFMLFYAFTAYYFRKQEIRAVFAR